MRRWVFVLLLMVVPFQWVWGAAASYCAHEASQATKKHFGHHEHQHEAGDEAPALDADDPADPSGTHHADCESCHLGCHAVVQAAAPAIATLPRDVAADRGPPRYRSHVPDGPRRPDRPWPHPLPRVSAAAC
jgi:hypothetical protein